MAATALPLESDAPSEQSQTHAGKPPALDYRPDLDGMRAVAVLLVLLFHAGVEWLPGGFVGVDVFFVLTGFLITSVLNADMRAGRFSFGHFYLRRIRRLLPALVAVCAATLVAGYLLLLPQDLLELLDSCRYTLASLSNVYFWLNTGGYFDADIHDLPLLHTWSLGVEEQFYLVWPALLLWGRRLSAPALSLVVVGAIALSLGLSQWWALRWPGAGYFLLPARAFEILIGALLALESERMRALSERMRSALSLLGIALVLAPALLLDDKAVFPGVNALWPCLGAALLIASGAGSGRLGLVNRGLSFKPLVVIGLLSYSIYLWHWPLLAYLNYRDVEVVGAVRWLAVVAPITAAAITYVLVEHPFRYRLRLSLAQALPALVVVPVALSVAAFSVARANAGFPGRFPAAAAQLEEGPTEASGACTYGRDLALAPQCSIGAPRAKPKGLVIGDSYAGMYIEFLDVLAKDAGIALNHRWYRLSPPIPGVAVKEQPDSVLSQYAERRHELLQQYDTGVLASSWGGYRYNVDETRRRLWNAAGDDVSARADDLQLAAIDDLVRRGVRVVVLDRPRAPPGRALMRTLRARVARGQSVARIKAPIRARGDDYVLDRVRDKHPNVLIVRPDDPICDEQACRVALGKTILYRPDGSHIGHEGSKLLAELYLKTYPNPLKDLR